MKKLFVGTLLLISVPVWAQLVPPAPSRQGQATYQTQHNTSLKAKLSAEGAVTPRNSEQEQQRMARLAKPWGLTVEDWKRVEELQKGPRQFWSPNLDPLTLLGVEARTPQERQRIADIQVQIEFERAGRELDYQRAYNAAFKKRYGNLLPINPAHLKITAPKSSRVLVFVQENCPACDEKVQLLQKDNAAFDIYVMGREGDDNAIRHWARTAGVDPRKVQSGQITLNHDNGTLQTLVGARSVSLPAVFHHSESSGKWVSVK